jgi:hypothetical protein
MLRCDAVVVGQESGDDLVQRLTWVLQYCYKSVKCDCSKLTEYPLHGN